MATSLFYVYVMATSFFYIFIDIDIDIYIDMEIQFGEWVGHGGWLIGPKNFRPKASPARAYYELCEFIILAGFHRAKDNPSVQRVRPPCQMCHPLAFSICYVPERQKVGNYWGAMMGEKDLLKFHEHLKIVVHSISMKYILFFQPCFCGNLAPM